MVTPSSQIARLVKRYVKVVKDCFREALLSKLLDFLRTNRALRETCGFHC